MRPPNLFNFATSELSQDAFICWLASWADPAHRADNEALHATATAFLDRLLEIGGMPKPAEYRSVVVRPQWNNIDVLLLVNGGIAVIIEDKTNTKDHSDQLSRYKATVARKFPDYHIAAVYLKTGDQCDYGSAERAGYGCFLRDHLLDLLKHGERSGVRNDVFSDFTRHLHGVEESVRGFLTVEPQHWERPQWKGFFMALKDKLGDGDWDHRGHAGGGSLTFRWHCLMERYLALHGAELGFRIVVADESQQEAKWSEWSRKLLAKNGITGIRIKQSRPRPGTRMKVAVLDGDYRRQDAGGLLDLAGTVETLRKAEGLMDAALGDE
jgi:hypothetical protein